MKVILIKDIGGVGKRDEVKEISDGYALNSLIPKGLAVQATKEAHASLKKRLAEDSASKGVSDAKLETMLAALNGKHIVIKVRANEQGHLFKAVTNKDVAEVLKKDGNLFSLEMIVVPAPIKQVGEYPLVIHSKNASADITLRVEAS